MGWKNFIVTIVKCSACGRYIVFSNEVDRDTQLLTRHARIHIEQDENFRLEFNDSPIEFPIQYTEVIEGEQNGW